MKKKIGLFGLLLGIVFLFFAVKPLIAPTLEKKISSITDKDYVNSKYKFQFKYPVDWQVEQWDIEKASNLTNVPDGTILYQGKFFGKSGHFEVLIWQNKSKAPVRSWLGWFRHEDLILENLPMKENSFLAGSPTILYLQKNTSRKKPILYSFFNKDDKIFELTEERQDLLNIEATNSAKFASPIYDKILASFRFMLQ